MAFFGHIAKAGQTTTVAVPEDENLVIVNATVAPGANKQPNTLFVEVDGNKVALCTLTFGRYENVSLGVVFASETQVSFSVVGDSDIHLTGHFVESAAEIDDEDDIEGLEGLDDDDDDEADGLDDDDDDDDDSIDSAPGSKRPNQAAALAAKKPKAAPAAPPKQAQPKQPQAKKPAPKPVSPKATQAKDQPETPSEKPVTPKQPAKGGPKQGGTPAKQAHPKAKGKK
eukprot:TRINITY_DN756_c0_g1_i2.p1 TRINITY_DN756_c0_g1~~TRINITY_DN756_c0_g1_i2.p1  ORF type:complete len:227 (-),score=144.45 TRINITY_DN756_c0_g1_i2:133-813(-)